MLSSKEEFFSIDLPEKNRLGNMKDLFMPWRPERFNEQVIGERWEIVGLLAEGGQGLTFLVVDQKDIDRPYYLFKIFKSPNRIKRFRREAELLQRLDHPNIVRLITFDDAEIPYIVTEFCAGGSLAKVRPFWNSSPIKALKIFQQICEGVAFIHGQDPPLTHRDLKPANIFFRANSDSVVIGDFGISYERDDTRITATGEVVGSKLFMAPELEDGRASEVTPKSDIYSLGKLLYWLLSAGKIFGREKHRELEWDLKGYNPKLLGGIGGWNNMHMEYVNQLLDFMIVYSPKERKDITEILALTNEVIKLLQRSFDLSYE